MTQSQPPITRTTHALPSGKLSPRDFERLCLWLVERERYERAEHPGAAGSEQGRDIVAWREGALWVFQCKRVQRFSPQDALAEVEKVLALPEDVSGENHGFDLHSTRYNADGTFADIRYIEVKARARFGAIRLSSTECKKARHFDKFWLHIVIQTATDAPQLHRIQNPAAQFRLDQDIFATGFIAPEERGREGTEDG